MKVSRKDEIRLAAEENLETFIRLIHPKCILGSVHSEIIEWWNRGDASSHQLVLMPRDHQKSRLVAYRVAQAIIRNPAIKILYISSTANLAVKQLKFIKDILTSDIVRHYWPDLVNLEEAKREKWSETEISVDHPKRKEENVRDPTVFTAGLTTTITGLHADIVVMDDVVVYENAYTQEGRDKVRSQFSLLASIAGGDAEQWIVGTRYHPRDLYNDLAEMEVDTYNDEGEAIGTYKLYEIFERQVEDRGDGTGQFLWPRQQRYDGVWFGFDQSILAKKRAQYLDKSQFYSQYYNNPNHSDDASVRSECFQYYEPKHLTRTDGKWYFRDRRLNVFASVDFAFSLKNKADYTAVVVLGVDVDRNYYIFDIERFKTDQIPEYFARLLRLHHKWDFRQLTAEVTAAQITIVNSLKDLVRHHGLALSIKDYRPGRTEGSKDERIAATLNHLYDNRQIWHYRGGNCQILEDELVLSNPPHDDVKDALTSCVSSAVAPSGAGRSSTTSVASTMTYSRFGGFC